ncbi:MAG TPA: hypothetical protein VHV08_16695 [Pirellulales bacterium]|jgi:hypothetical protein|nr:hypothetical protein [Pirellulales bacterium]
MTFQFLCPQGHLLQGEEAHMGMQCQCPQCGMAFIIPTVEHAITVDSLIASVDQPAHEPEPAAELDVSDAMAPGDDALAEAASNLDVGEVPLGGPEKAAEIETLLHIPCPNGHELETPLDMIGQRVMCPHCQAEFRLRREKSIEYLREQEIIDRRRSRFWLQLSIVAVCFVGVVLVGMFAMMAFSE